MVIECSRVTKRFGSQVVVDELDLSVPAGGCFGLLGPNGAGKTTTLKMIYGVTAPTEGSIRVFGEDVTKHPRRVRARLGVTLQENALIEVLTPVENLRVFGRYHLLSEAKLDDRIPDLLDFLDLRSHAHLPVVALSGGFQRRLQIALSLVNEPELLILDEPTTGLDPAVRLALWSRIGELRARGTTVLITTHYMDEAERLCDRLAILSEGRRLVEGSPRELIDAHLARAAVEIDQDPAHHASLLARLNGVHHLKAGRRLMIYGDDGPALLEAVQRAGGDPAGLVSRPSNLEDVFLALTGTGLDGDA
ncbi:MAG: ABC transporter ATP-binding protein [bacterium]|nr:ABC transporter ATP-binding protein [bacterium]MCP5064990.1 ABC transporter ATP-binding protein [bacterium]